MKNNSIKLAAILAVVVIGLMGCRRESADVRAIDTQLAQKTLQGTYVYIDVDSVKMATNLYEWNLAPAGEGSYRIASTGNGTDGDDAKVFTWSEATMAEDNLSMSIPVKMQGKDITLLWRNGVLEVDSLMGVKPYITAKSVISQAAILRQVAEAFVNLDFVYNDTTFYLTIVPDTVPYLAWKTEVVSFTQDSIDAYKQFLVDMADTLAWFNRTFPNSAVPDTVRFSNKQQPDGTYKGQISRPYETFLVEMDTTNHGPLEIVNGEMIFNRTEGVAGPVNTGGYLYHYRSWSKEFYDEPTSEKAVSYDSLCSVTPAQWTPVAFTNVKKFEVLVKGPKKVEVTASKAGKSEVRPIENTTAGYELVQLSAFSKDEGVVTHNEKKYTLKK